MKKATQETTGCGGMLHHIIDGGPNFTTLEAVCDRLNVGLHLGNEAVVETNKTNIPNVDDTIVGGATLGTSTGYTAPRPELEI